jgi:hypothetical protein
MVNDVDLDLWALLQRGKPISVLVAESVRSAIGVARRCARRDEVRHRRHQPIIKVHDPEVATST